MHSSSSASSQQQLSAPHVWSAQSSAQATFASQLNEKFKVIWEQGFPSIVMKDHETPVIEVSSYGTYEAFVRRFRELDLNKGADLYFIYADLLEFKNAGGTYKELQRDNPLRRKLIAECFDLYIDVLNKDFGLSKAMSNILRHNAQKLGVYLTKDGFADIGMLIERDPGNRILETIPHKWDPDFWYFMIVSNDKQRYAYQFTDKGVSITAVQGHSIKGIDAHGEVPMTFNNIPSTYAVHATTYEAWNQIRHEGLYPGRRLKPPHNASQRQDVHFATVLPENRLCRMGGLRENRPIWIFVENTELVRTNLEPRISFNGYVLTSYNVPSRIFACALEVSTGKDLRGGYRASDKILQLVKPCFEDPPPEEYIDTTEELRSVASAHVEPLTRPSDLELIGEFFDVKRQQETEQLQEQLEDQEASVAPTSSAHVDESALVEQAETPDVKMDESEDVGSTIMSVGSEDIKMTEPFAVEFPQPSSPPAEFVVEEPDWSPSAENQWDWHKKCTSACGRGDNLHKIIYGGLSLQISGEKTCPCPCAYAQDHVGPHTCHDHAAMDFEAGATPPPPVLPQFVPMVPTSKATAQVEPAARMKQEDTAQVVEEASSSAPTAHVVKDDIPPMPTRPVPKLPSGQKPPEPKYPPKREALSPRRVQWDSTIQESERTSAAATAIMLPTPKGAAAPKTPPKASSGIPLQEEVSVELGVARAGHTRPLEFKRDEWSRATRQRSTSSSGLATQLISKNEKTIIEVDEAYTKSAPPLWPAGFQHDLAKPSLPIIKETDVRNLTSAHVEDAARRDAWFRETIKHLMGSRTGSQRTAENVARTQCNSLQLSFACFNLGNLARKSKVRKEGSSKFTVLEHGEHPLAHLWASNWANIIITLEAEALRLAEGERVNRLAQQMGLQGVSVHFPNSGKSDIACHVRGDDSAHVECEWKRRWPTDERSTWQCVAAQFLVTFGQKSISDEVPFTRDDIKGLPISYQEAASRLDLEDPEVLRAALVVKRAGMSQVRVMAYHIESSKGGRAHNNCREYLKVILRRCAEVQVDLLFCDGNLAASRNHKAQSHTDIPNSTVCQSYRQFQQLLNEDVELANRVAMTVFDNNPAHLSEVDMTPEERDQTDWDCCIAAVFGWGKTATQRLDRIKYKTDAAHVAKRLGFEQVDLSQMRTADFEVTPKDWHATMSERALQIDRRDLWLGENDTDYHRPMFITVRNFATKNFRYRAQSKIDERKQKQREKKGKGKGKSTTAATSSSSSSWDTSSWTRTAATWTWYASSSASGANGESTDKDEFPHMWNIWDTLFIILLVVMMLNLVYSIYTCLRCKRSSARKNQATQTDAMISPPVPVSEPASPPSSAGAAEIRRRPNGKMYHFYRSGVVHHSDCRHVRDHPNAEKYCIGRQCLVCGR